MKFKREKHQMTIINNQKLHIIF